MERSEYPLKRKRYHCVATFIGGIGQTKAALVADRLIQQYNLVTIVNIGIAGSMDNDVQLGDVIVAEQADSYLESSKAVENEANKDFEFRLSGDPYKSSPDYVVHTQNLEFAHPASAKDWVDQCKRRLEELMSEATLKELYNKKLLKQSAEIYTGNLASGPVVGETTFFVEWLKNRRDRKYLALEMESAGIMIAAHTRATPTLIIRGISDYCDNRKKELDEIGNGLLRRYAMSNAIALLWTLTDLSLVKRY